MHRWFRWLIRIWHANRRWWVRVVLIHEFVFRGPSTIALLDYSFASRFAGFCTCGFYFSRPDLVSSPVQLSFMMWCCPTRERFSVVVWCCLCCCVWFVSDIYSANIKHHYPLIKWDLDRLFGEIHGQSISHHYNSEPFWTFLNDSEPCSAGCLGNLLQHRIYPAAQVLHLTQEGQKVPPHNHCKKMTDVLTFTKNEQEKLQ